jgi:hypothetical protein
VAFVVASETICRNGGSFRSREEAVRLFEGVDQDRNVADDHVGYDP